VTGSGGHNKMVSVIIPTYNRSKLLRRAIQSVLAQTYQDIELIVVDDGSTDDTRGGVEGFNDSRIRYIQHGENKGANAARNTGVKATNGEYINFLDDDDELFPEKLERQIGKLRGVPNSVGLIYCRAYYSMEGQKDATCPAPSLRGNLHLHLLKKNLFLLMTPLIRKECFQKAGLFDEALPGCQDWDMWIRIAKYFEFDFIPDILAKYHVHGEQISADLITKMDARAMVVRKHQSDFCKYPRILSDHLRRLGVFSYLAGRRRDGDMYIWKALKQNPLAVKNYLHLIFSSLAPVRHKEILSRRQFTMGSTKFYY